MTLGEKIKELRKTRHMTQKDLAADFITRNMLSAIESGKATPSLETLRKIASALGVPADYLIAEDEGLFVYRKKEAIGKIRDLFRRKSYPACLKTILSLGETDDELSFLAAECSFRIGQEALRLGSLYSAVKALEAAAQYAESTCYPTERIRLLVPLYLAVAQNFQSPLLVLDPKRYQDALADTADYEFFKYITLDADYSFKDERFRKHMEAKKLMKEYHYQEAISLLSEIENEKTRENYHASVIFGVYADLESAAKQIGDFELAYRYASKRLSMIEGFKS